MGVSSSAGAVTFESGDLYGSFDTTFSYGLAYRISDRDRDILGIAASPESGRGFSVNNDDGNQNFGKGLVSEALKVTSELELKYGDFAAFVRGTAFYDFEVEDGEREKIPLTDEAKDQVGSDVRLLDAFASYRFYLGEMPGEVRVGEQVISWGESTFIQNSINTINHVDVGALRVPGAELREALLPDGIVYGSIAPTENTSVEAYYQYDWDKTDIDPSGSYFSTVDFAGQGGERVLLGFGAVPDSVPPNVVVSPPSLTAVVARAPDRNPGNDGQYGLALRFFLPELNDSEIGLYYIHYSSKLPLVNAITGTPEGALGVDPDGQSYVQTARYFFEYPDDIKLYGLSFNTDIGNTGIALQGEFSYRQDVPLQIDDIEILFAALGAQDNLAPGATPAAPLAQFNQLGRIPFDEVVPGYIRRDVMQFQATLTKVLGPVFGANTGVIVTEAAISHVLDMPDKNELRLDGPGTYISGNEALAAFHYGLFENAEHFATATSWGYRVAGRLTYNNVFSSINLEPRFSWQHDVNGISPGPGGNFIEDRKAITLGLKAIYQNQFEADISYTNFFGAGRYNLLNDRDFVALTFKYSL
ncbi:MAG: DUF1302 domain-containing protein [Chromatiales bacterium]|nr:DUF1302 domain-containing protein [Chromatiales bacterium]